MDNTQVIKAASMPVLKLECKEILNSLRVDITIKDSRHKGIECVHMVKHYLELYPELEPLVVVLKYLLRSAQLNDPYTVSYIYIYI